MVAPPPPTKPKAPYTMGTLSTSLIFSKLMIFGLDNDTGVPCTSEITCGVHMNEQNKPNKYFAVNGYGQLATLLKRSVNSYSHFYLVQFHTLLLQACPVPASLSPLYMVRSLLNVIQLAAVFQVLEALTVTYYMWMSPLMICYSHCPAQQVILAMKQLHSTQSTKIVPNTIGWNYSQ